MANTSLLITQNPLRIDFDTSLFLINGYLFCLNFYVYTNISWIWLFISIHYSTWLNFHSIWLPAIASIEILVKISCIMFLFCWKTIHGLTSSLKVKEWLTKWITRVTWLPIHLLSSPTCPLWPCQKGFTDLLNPTKPSRAGFATSLVLCLKRSLLWHLPGFFTPQLQVCFQMLTSQREIPKYCLKIHSFSFLTLFSLPSFLIFL